MKRLPYLLLLLTLAGSLAVAGRSRRSAADEDRAKADYIFLEALRAKSQDNHDVAYELLKHARRLNGGDKTIGANLALYQLALTSDDAGTAESMEMMRAYYHENPEDLFHATRFALLCEQLDLTDEARGVWRKIAAAHPEQPEFSYHLAELLAKDGSEEGMDEALAIYDTLEVSEGLSIPLASRRIEIFHQKGDTTAIIKELNRVLEGAPRSVDAWVFAGDFYTALHLNDEAKEHYDSACAIDPSSGLAKYSRARYYNTIGDSAAFEHEIYEALGERDLELETKLSMLKGYIQETITDSVSQPQVEELFDRLIEMHPHEHDIHSLYAHYLIVYKRYADAAVQTEHALDADPSDQTEWEMLTSLYLQSEELDKAQAAIHRSLRYFPEDARQFLMLGAIMHQKEEFDKALQEYEHAKAYTDSTDAVMMSQIYQSMGDVYYQKKQPETSFEYYEKAIQLNPENYMALNNFAYHLANEGRDLELAQKSILKVLMAEPDNENALDTYAWVLFKMKDYAKAREIIDETLGKIEEPNGEVYEHAGDIYFMDSEPDQAVEFWKKALELDPDNELLKKKVTHKTYFYK